MDERTVVVTSVDVSGTDNDKQKFCSDFTLQKSEAQRFFNNAGVISAGEMHDVYSYLLSYVKGKCKIDGTDCTWEIRAGGTAYADTESESLIYGCQTCSDF